ncbi:MAG: hypothetical protein PT939_06565 [Aerococcus suis]|nr:hypothetical protein [Aerococcus suis]
MWQTLIDNVGLIASLFLSLSTISAGLMWAYNFFIGEPKERKRREADKEYQDKMLKMTQEQTEPIYHLIDKIDASIEANSKLFDIHIRESEADRKNLNRVVETNSKLLENHDKALDNHEGRLIRVETYLEIPKGERIYRKEYIDET